MALPSWSLKHGVAHALPGTARSLGSDMQARARTCCQWRSEEIQQDSSTSVTAGTEDLPEPPQSEEGTAVVSDLTFCHPRVPTRLALQ
jgi:hypothetical protein